MTKTMQTANLKHVTVNDKFWSPIQNLVIDTMLPYQADVLEDKIPGIEKSHAIQNFRIAANEAQGEFYGMVFQDSDVAKWLEAVAYALTIRPNTELERRADEYIALIGRAQEQDGYLNTFFTVREPKHKWQNLQGCHELYCSGHMLEAAIAYYEATGKDELLQIMRRNADLICSRFGADKVRGFPGHQEIEIALLRLYDITGEARYLETAQYFLDERGREPNFFAQEAEARAWQHFKMKPEDREYAQNHMPAKEQDVAVGHCVRAVYMYTSMAMLAAATGDSEWLAACKKLWQNITRKQMYITGGIGATAEGEAFSKDYDLPNDTCYNETCASIAMIFFARQMLEIEASGKYADIMELQLYNGVLSGMQLDGKRFFYVNPLEVVPGISGNLHGHRHVKQTRPDWYTCSCCPPNLARLITSLGQYAWGESEDTIWNHLYIAGSAELGCAGGVKIDCETNYPTDGIIKYTLFPKKNGTEFTLAVRIPAWCKKWVISASETALSLTQERGYVYITREWNVGDTVTLNLEILPSRIYCNTLVRDNAGCVALKRGPFVYCFEEIDNAENLSALRLPVQAELKISHEDIPNVGDVTVIEADGLILFPGDDLYSDSPPDRAPQILRAIPYYAWGNREPGGMRVWMLEG